MTGLPMNGLTPLQEKAIVALLSEPTVTKAAECAGVTTRTVYRWLDDPSFARQFRRLRRESFSQAIALAQRYAPMAIGTLAKIMADPSAPHASRVSAAAVLLKFGRDSIELDELVGRMDALEVASGIVKAWEEIPGLIRDCNQLDGRTTEESAQAPEPTPEQAPENGPIDPPEDDADGGF